MSSSKMKFAGKAAGSVVVAVALMASVAGLAGAAPSNHSRFGHHGVSSVLKSIFVYARIGEGGYVTAVTSTSMTVDRCDGQTTTYTITPTTTFTEGGSPTTAASLVVGDRVNIRLARSAPTTALKINIELAGLAGRVSSVNGDTITVIGGQGFTRTILVSTATNYLESGLPATLADVTVGEYISAQGTIDVNQTSLDALTVDIGQTYVARGLATAVTSTSVTVNRLDGQTTTYTITPTTVFTQGKTTLTAASLVVGDRIDVVLNSTAPAVALRINIDLSRVAGKVTAINGDTITLTGLQGFTRTVLVSDTTTYTQGGSPATFADVLVGSDIIAKGTVDPNLTTLDATSVDIVNVGHPETFVGSVTAATLTSVTVNRLDGKTTTFVITPTTIVTEGSSTLSAASLTVGDRVSVDVNSAAPTTALKINIELATLGGRVTSVVGSLITITSYQGFSREILVSPTTTYTQGGVSVTLAAVTVNSKIVAQGTVDPNLTTLDATSVAIVTPVVTGHSETFHGLVTAVVPNTSVTLNRLNGITTTYTITPTTTFTEGSATMTAAALVVGDSAGITVNSSAPTTALSINIVLATMEGHVTAVVGDLITITGGEGFARTIMVSSATTYTEGGASVTLAAVTVGSKIVALGQVAADLTTLDATSITIS